MQPFKLESTCVKCGWSNQVRVIYQQGTVSPFKEYLQRKCKGCGYCWREATLDTPMIDTLEEGFMKGDEECTSE
jgi:uncharacterized Zn finger protein